MTFKLPLFLVGATLLSGLAARADVSWQHTGSISANGQTLLTFQFNNSWSGANHRALLKYDATPMADTAAMMGGPSMGDTMAKGSVNFIERLDDDRLILAVPTANTYIDEPYSTLRERTRMNIWEGLNPALGKGEIPELTDVQRDRLGAELRAVLSPFSRRLTRTYFRPLPGRRVISGLNCNGYRYTMLFNTTAKPGGNNWTKITAEWYFADTLPGDDEIVSFTQRANKVKSDGGPPTQSMWLNEYFPVLWQAAPPELHRAIETVTGAPDSANYGFGGTPVALNVTGNIPPVSARAKATTFRFALNLKSRDQTAVAPAVFAGADRPQAPAGRAVFATDQKPDDQDAPASRAEFGQTVRPQTADRPGGSDAQGDAAALSARLPSRLMGA